MMKRRLFLFTSGATALSFAVGEGSSIQAQASTTPKAPQIDPKGSQLAYWWSLVTITDGKEKPPNEVVWYCLRAREDLLGISIDEKEAMLAVQNPFEMPDWSGRQTIVNLIARRLFPVNVDTVLTSRGNGHKIVLRVSTIMP